MFLGREFCHKNTVEAAGRGRGAESLPSLTATGVGPCVYGVGAACHTSATVIPCR